MVIDKFQNEYLGNITKKLTQPFKLRKNTKLKDLLDCIGDEISFIRNQIIQCEDLVIYNNNKGKQLDLLGSNFNEKRNLDTDEDFLDRIIFIKQSAGSLGDENTIINAVSNYLNVEKSKIKIETVDIRKIKVRFENELPNLIKTSRILKQTKAAGIRLVTSHRYQYQNTQNYSYAHFLSDSMEFVQDVRKFREIKNETNYSYSTMVSDSVEYRQERI